MCTSYCCDPEFTAKHPCLIHVQLCNEDLLIGSQFHGQETYSPYDLEETDDEIFSDTDTSIDLDSSGPKSHTEVCVLQKCWTNIRLLL